ncbi:hypothetical protein B7463_g831, partial [Scytalidium lignicola]
MERPTHADVLIVGGGPVGLLTAYQLARLGVSVHIVDKEPKLSLGNYGRANAIYPRSTELLDQLSLADNLIQQCHICRDSYTYDENGKRVVPGRVWNFVENIDDTWFDFAIMLRQQHVEKSFREHLMTFGVSLQCQTECIDFEVVSPDREGNYIKTTLKDMERGSEYIVKSKYLVGADGGKSFVRRHLNVPFEGDTTEDKWIRIDGKIKSNIPNPRAYGSIQSPTHGNVLWAPLDRNITRIGYVFTREQEERCHGNPTEEVVVKEAIAAMKPFEIEFQSVEWWTLYIIGQRVASTYQPHPRILLVGDSCHTHSSGAAQGLNTGIHDATNLGWKLALVLKGLAKDTLLDTYSSERRGAAERLINFDRKISSLMANKWPDGLKKSGNEDINQALEAAFNDAAGLVTGLKISYSPNIINVQSADTHFLASVTPGSRVPDVGLIKPGTLEQIRLHSATPNCACLYVVAFVGDPRTTIPRISSFSSYLQTQASFQHIFPSAAVRLLSIIAADPGLDVEDALGVEPFGTTYFDDKRNAHRRYGIDVRQGAILVLRPDGIVGFIAELEAAGGEAVTEYLNQFLVHRA